MPCSFDGPRLVDSVMNPSTHPTPLAAVEATDPSPVEPPGYVGPEMLKQRDIWVVYDSRATIPKAPWEDRDGVPRRVGRRRRHRPTDVVRGGVDDR